jgi:ATP-dependent Clp protease ATP-binding subunit ClpX
MDIEKTISKIKSFYDDIKKIELLFFKNNDINIVLEDDAVDFIIEQFEKNDINVEDYYEQLTDEFKHGLNLIREKTGKNRFFITKNALFNPETFISKLIKDELSHGLLTDSQNPNLET